MSEDDEAVRGFVQALLPDRIVAALAGYERFTAEDPPADPKAFAAWHAAAKAALVHVEVLVKLARWAEGKGEDCAPAGDDGLGRMLAQARAALDDLDDDGEDDP